MSVESKIHDVVQIGYGPVGQVSAALLGNAGHDVAIFERHKGLYALPRAGHVDHEMMRLFQSMNCVDAILEDIYRCSNYGWQNQNGETLIDIDWSRDGISGWASDYLMYQPYLEDALDRAVRHYPTVEINHGWEAIELKEHTDFVELTLIRRGVAYGDEEKRKVRGRYLIGADGANSFVRKAIGLPLEDQGFDENWLVADFRQKRPLKFDFDNGQICDPTRPLCLFQLGRTHRRFEFMMLPGEDRESLLKPETIWSLVSGWMGPDDVDLIRAAVYNFRSVNALQWRSGRSFIAGDAAHLMPPFLGQGMCSGLRDAANLAWKLDLVLRGQADEKLLDTYLTERRPHVDSIIKQAIVLGKISCTVDPEEARQRDQAFFSGNVPPPPPFPWIEKGVLQENPSNAAKALIGHLGPQALVRRGDLSGLADDVVGSGWQLIVCEDIGADLDPGALAVLRALDVKVINIGLVGSDRVEDSDGLYARYFEATGVRAVLVRPDFYVFGAVENKGELPALLADLADQLHLKLDASVV